MTMSTTAQAAIQSCSVDLGNGTRAMLRIDDRGRTIDALAMDFVQLVGGSAHECSFGARRGGGHSRWRSGRASTYVTINDPDTGTFEAAVQRHRGDLQLSIGAPGGDLATCGTIAVPGTVIVTLRPNGRCVARLPGRR